MTAPAIPTREDITAAWMLDPTFDVARALAERTALVARFATATIVAIADDIDFDSPEVCGCDECVRREAIR